MAINLQKSIELILFRQLVSGLATPAFIIGPSYNIIFCNEAAEKILGFRFAETGEISEIEWSTIFMPQDKNGNAIHKEKLPFHLSYTQHCLANDTFYLRSLDNKVRHIEMIALPIINQMGVFYGAASFFQEVAT